MSRPTGLFSGSPEAANAVENRALGTLAFIRASIESSSSMDVPGRAGIVMGLIGVATAIAVSVPPLSVHWLGIWLAAAALALLLGGAIVARQIAAKGRERYWGPARRFLLCLCPALLAGAVLTVVLARAGDVASIPGMWLLLYGCAVLSASTVTSSAVSRLICAMGISFAALGCVTFALPGIAHTVMLGFGFGGLHLLFGFLIGRASHAD